MFSGTSLENAKRVNLLYWHLNPYVFDKLCDNEWQGPEQLFAKHVINQPWWEWAKEKDLTIYSDMHHLALDNVYVYIAYTNMLPRDETYWVLKWNVTHIKDME